MQKTQFGGLISELWLDLQQPAVLWQAGVLALCLGLAWLVARALRRSSDEAQDQRFGQRGLKRLASPWPPSFSSSSPDRCSSSGIR